jgi:hypothetical protein
MYQNLTQTSDNRVEIWKIIFIRHLNLVFYY